MSKQVADVLRAAADLIEPKGRWTQDAAARDAQGRQLRADDPSAVCWCTWGALRKVNQAEPDEAFALLAFVTGFSGHDPSQWGECWNDDPDRTQAEAVAALREAADLAEAQA